MQNTFVRAGFVVVLCGATAAAFADDLNVPSQYASIADALHAAKPGDRVVVRGGRYADPHLIADDVSFVGIGATLSGVVRVGGARVAVSGFRIADKTQMFVYGQDIALSKNRSNGRARWSIFAWGGERITIDGNVGSGATIQAGGVYANLDWSATGDISLSEISDVVVRGNRVKSIEMHGDRCVVAENRTTSGVVVEGDDAELRGNVFSAGVAVRGERVVVRSNSLRRSTAGLVVTGGDSTIVGNEVTVFGYALSYDGCPGMGFDAQPAIDLDGLGRGATVSGNKVRHSSGLGLQLRVDGAAVCDNVIVGVSSDASLSISGSGNTLERNTVTHSGSYSGDGIDVAGDTNTLNSNRVVGTAVYGISVASGTANVVNSNVVSGAASGGVQVGEFAVDTNIADCMLIGCRLGVVDSGQSTILGKSVVVRRR